MKQLVTLAALAFAWLAAPAFADKLGPLVSPQALEAIEAASKPLIIDIRGNNDKGESLFEAGHIAGAVNAPYGLFVAPAITPVS